MAAVSLPRRKTPWHLWVLGSVALLWNASGAYTVMMAQAGTPDVSADEAYYTAQPLWFAVVTDVAPFLFDDCLNCLMPEQSSRTR